MGLETGDFIDDLNPDWPLDTDPKSQGDDHLRLIKKTLKQTFPGFDAPFVPAPGVTGEVKTFPLEPPGAGVEMLLCNGEIYLVEDFPALGAFLGGAYGGDGIIDFAVPDKRGKFIRGTDDGAGLDPNAAARTDRGDGTTGDAPGTNQVDAFRSHTHSKGAVRTPTGGAVGGVTNTPAAAPNNGGANPQNDPTGGSETRPVNINVLFYILV